MTDNLDKRDGRHGNYWRIAAWAGAAILLLLPLAAMQFSNEVNWGLGDFVLAGALVVGTGLLLELAVRAQGSLAYRLAAGLALGAALLLVWINLAVGIIGSEDEPANLLYGGVLAVGLIGAILARFQPQGMARALLATATAQVLVAVIALAAGWGAGSTNWPLPLLAITGFFVALFGGSALLFRQAARERAAGD
jgi:hypothetical protein